MNFTLLHCPSPALALPLPAARPHYPSATAQPIWHTMQHELLCFLVPFFMANHPNSAGVLHFAWQGAAVSGVGLGCEGEG